MKLYVDDRRDAPPDWELCRSITKAIMRLSTGYVEEISLDFDCGIEDESYMAVAHYIHAMPVDMRPIVHIHTDNPAGRLIMQQILNDGL